MLYIDENILLETDFAQELYRKHAQRVAVIDYHSHISPHDVAVNRTFDTITSIWMENNHALPHAQSAISVVALGLEVGLWN